VRTYTHCCLIRQTTEISTLAVSPQDYSRISQPETLLALTIATTQERSPRKKTITVYRLPKSARRSVLLRFHVFCTCLSFFSVVIRQPRIHSPFNFCVFSQSCPLALPLHLTSPPPFSSFHHHPFLLLSQDRRRQTTR
jgi:hypothetical protein